MKDCSFNKACAIFKAGNCTAESIDKKECQGPIINGFRIITVAKISRCGHLIAIINQCPKCEKLYGIISGDTEGSSYRADAVELSPAQREKIPFFICRSCLWTGHFVFQQAPVVT